MSQCENCIYFDDLELDCDFDHNINEYNLCCDFTHVDDTVNEAIR